MSYTSGPLPRVARPAPCAVCNQPGISQCDISPGRYVAMRLIGASSRRQAAAPGPVGGVDYRALAAFRSALRRFLRASAERARAVGMSAQQHQLLLAIKGHAGADPPLMGELAEALQVSPHAAVGLANRAARAGLLRRITVSSDRRRVGLVLTARGERLLASVT